ncbi:SPOR domain-containing protein [candidate division KSB1 bacterium]|nr:SPOR domain-containing protein [candidate division KSB1 bacterium]
MRSIFIILIMMIICAGTVFSLAQSRADKKKSAVNDSAAVRLDESWEPSPSDGLIDDFTLEMDEGLSPEDLDDMLKGDERNGITEEEFVPGFRIQVIATRNEEEARQARTDALLNLQHNVYLLYDDPYYKIRVGDCLSHAEADSLQREAIRKGFVGAWIVRTSVLTNPPRLPAIFTTPADSTGLDP